MVEQQGKSSNLLTTKRRKFLKTKIPQMSADMSADKNDDETTKIVNDENTTDVCGHVRGQKRRRCP